MKEKDFLYQVLYYALIEIRMEAHDINNRKIFKLTDLLHNLPLKLNQIEAQADYRTVLKELKERATEGKIQKWIEDREKEFEEYLHKESGADKTET